MNEVTAASEFVYDKVGYPAALVERLTPDQLRATALMRGWSTADPATASVLEIGCSDGLNITAIGAAAPGSRCVGFDLSASAIAAGRERVAAAGMTNVDLQHADILSFPRHGEPFDYIVCHGVYTWVPQAVREPLLELMAARLAPGGLIYMGYDALPTAAVKAELNKFLIAHTAHVEDAADRVDMAIKLAAVLARHQRERSRFTTVLKHLVEDAPNYVRYYVFHDWLAEFYEPVSIAELGKAAKVAGLAFAGDAALLDLYWGDIDDEGREIVLAAGDDLMARNAAFDLLRGVHSFRGDLLVRADAPPPAAVNPMSQLSFAFNGSREELSDKDVPTVRYARSDDAILETFNTDLQKLLDILVAAAPGEVTFDELVKRTGFDEAAMQPGLQNVVIMGLVERHATPQPFVLSPGERPLASPLVRGMLAHGTSAITLRHRRKVVEQAPTRYMIVLCDGTRTRAEIAAAMSAEFGQPIPVETVAAAIASFAAHRLFLA